MEEEKQNGVNSAEILVQGIQNGSHSEKSAEEGDFQDNGSQEKPSHPVDILHSRFTNSLQVCVRPMSVNIGPNRTLKL